jgi:hypothetical protein
VCCKYEQQRKALETFRTGDVTYQERWEGKGVDPTQTNDSCNSSQHPFRERVSSRQWRSTSGALVAQHILETIEPVGQQEGPKSAWLASMLDDGVTAGTGSIEIQGGTERGLDSWYPGRKGTHYSARHPNAQQVFYSPSLPPSFILHHDPSHLALWTTH